MALGEGYSDIESDECNDGESSAGEGEDGEDERRVPIRAGSPPPSVLIRLSRRSKITSSL